MTDGPDQRLNDGEPIMLTQESDGEGDNNMHTPPRRNIQAAFPMNVTPTTNHYLMSEEDVEDL